MATSLPIEITDGIIDCVQDDRSTLLSCSLVCSSWCTRSQHHLFAHVALEELQQIERLSAVLTETPHLAAHILHVELPLTLDSCDTFLDICPLPRVKEITLLQGSPVRDICARRLAIAFPNVRSVTFLETAFVRFSALLELLREFPQAVDVHLNGAFRSHCQVGTLQPPSLPSPSLESLSLELYGGARMFHCWLEPCVYTHLQGLRRLKVCCHAHATADDMSSIGVLAARMPHTLEELDISVFYMDIINDFVAGYCANKLPGANPVLRHLRLSSASVMSGPMIDSELAVLVAHIRDIGLDSVEIETIIFNTPGMEVVTWSAVEEELTRAPFPCRFALIAPGLVYNSENYTCTLVEA